MANCRKCGVTLIIGKNWTEGRKRNYRYLCKDCNNKQTYALRRKNVEKYLKYHREYQRKFKKRQNEKIKKILGDNCFFCGFKPKRRISAHEIHGNKHSETSSYILNHIEDFVPLCSYCHRAVHFCMNFLDLSWEDILMLVKKKNV